MLVCSDRMHAFILQLPAEPGHYELKDSRLHGSRLTTVSLRCINQRIDISRETPILTIVRNGTWNHFEFLMVDLIRCHVTREETCIEMLGRLEHTCVFVGCRPYSIVDLIQVRKASQENGKEKGWWRQQVGIHSRLPQNTPLSQTETDCC